jgi:hypothetical protein
MTSIRIRSTVRRTAWTTVLGVAAFTAVSTADGLAAAGAPAAAPQPVTVTAAADTGAGHTVLPVPPAVRTAAAAAAASAPGAVPSLLSDEARAIYCQPVVASDSDDPDAAGNAGEMAALLAAGHEADPTDGLDALYPQGCIVHQD